MRGSPELSAWLSADVGTMVTRAAPLEPLRHLALYVCFAHYLSIKGDYRSTATAEASGAQAPARLAAGVIALDSGFRASL